MTPMFIYKKYIQKLIEEEVNRIFVEQTTPAKPADEPSTEKKPAPEAPAGGDASPDLNASGDAGDINAAPETGAADLGADLGGDLGGANLGGDSGDLGGEDLGDEEAGADLGGGGFGGPSGGGGFSFGGNSGGEEGLTPDDESEEDTANTIGPEDVEKPTDPVMAIADEAIEMLKTTRQPNLILKNVKASIQQYFDNFEDSTPVIKALWDTEDTTLRDVARRLLLFIRGI